LLTGIERQREESINQSIMDDSFDIGEFEGTSSFVTSTAWSSRVASKPKGRRTYGRRGSVDNVTGSSQNRKNTFGARSRVASLERTSELSPSTSQSTGTLFKEEEEKLAEEEIDEDDEWNTDRDSNISTPPIPPRKGRTFVRSHTISGTSPNISRGRTRPPQLRRSQSVSNSISSRSSSTSSRSFSMSTSSMASLPVEEGCCDDFDGSGENYNPNFFGTPNNGSLLDSISPKRSALFEGSNKKCRKKSKPAANQNAFMKNDFTPLDSNDGGVSGSISRHNNTKLPEGSTLGDSFSDLARNSGEVRTSWATKSTGSCPSNYSSSRTEESTHRRRLSSHTDLFSPTTTNNGSPDQDMNGSPTDDLSSPAMSMASSTRKRGVCKSQFSDDESSPVSRSRSRILSPPSIRMSEASSFSASVDSKYRVGSRLMDVSFQSTTKSCVKINRAMADLDVTMSDDDVNKSCETNGEDSDISVDSEDDDMSVIPRLNSIRARERPSSNMSNQILELENATVDDVVKSMSSIEDIEFLSTSLQKSIIRQGGCIIAPPVKWEAKRRDAFFQWTTKSLGFTFRPGGGNFSFIQTTKTRGSRLLVLLNATLKSLKSCDEGEMRESLSNIEESNSIDFDFSSAVKRELQPTRKFSKMIRLTPKE
jgi:hypothetical protein